MNEQPRIPLFFPGKSQLEEKVITVIAGDVGGTKTNLALYNARKDNMDLVLEKTYHSSKYSSCIDILKQFLSETENAGKAKPDRICLGVAGPVVQGKVELTNLSWQLDIEDIRNSTGIAEVF